MERVFVTGRGVISPLGNGLAINEDALQKGRSGVAFIPSWEEKGLDSQIAGLADNDPPSPLVDRKRKRFSGPASLMTMAAAHEAILEAGLDPEELKNKRVAVVMGSSGSAYEEVYNSTRSFYKSGKTKKAGPFTVPRVMPSSAASNLAILFGIEGETYNISSACTSGVQSVVLGARLIESGLYDIVLAGGVEETNWVFALGFNALRALSTRNDNPTAASRPFDKDRDGFVIAEGAGVIVLESESHAKHRGVKGKCVISGSALTNTVTDMVVPDIDSSAKAMAKAIKNAGLEPSDIGYVNTHGTSTPVGDKVEMGALEKVFSGSKHVAINSTKSLTGHMIGATGTVEIIYSSLVLEKQFIAPTLNLDTPEDHFMWADLVRETRYDVGVKHVMSNSFGFGGANGTIIISKI